MPDIKISGLPAASSVAGTDEFEANQSGTSRKVTASQVQTFALSGYTGATTIVTLGTVTTGTWSGTAIAVANGGTGATTAAGARTNLGAAASGAVGSSGLTMTTARVLGRTTAATGAVEELSSVPVTLGGTGATTASSARQNLLPSYSGNANKVLSLNGSASDVVWTTPQGGTPGGSSGEIQYNNAGSFGGIAEITYDSTSGAVTTRNVKSKYYDHLVENGLSSYFNLSASNGMFQAIAVELAAVTNYYMINLPSAVAGAYYQILLYSYPNGGSQAANISWGGGGTLRWADSASAAPTLDFTNWKYHLLEFRSNGSHTFGRLVGKFKA